MTLEDIHNSNVKYKRTEFLVKNYYETGQIDLEELQKETPKWKLHPNCAVLYLQVKEITMKKISLRKTHQFTAKYLTDIIRHSVGTDYLKSYLSENTTEERIYLNNQVKKATGDTEFSISKKFIQVVENYLIKITINNDKSFSMQKMDEQYQFISSLYGSIFLTDQDITANLIKLCIDARLNQIEYLKSRKTIKVLSFPSAVHEVSYEV